MEPVGFVGIIKLSTLIIRNNLKHFLCIALILGLPLALQALLADTTGSVKLFVFFLHKLSGHQGSDEELPPAPASTPSLLAAKMACLAFMLAVTLACTPLLTFSVCRACLGKSVDMRGSARGIARSVGNLLLTILCVMALYLVVVIAASLVAVAVARLGGRTAGALISVAGVLAVSAGLIYLAIGLYFADIVAILEASRGWEALRRSMYLVGHKRGVTLGLLLLFFVCSLLLLLLPVVLSDSRWIAVSLGSVANALLSLFIMVSRVVLYMSCRASLHEPLDGLLPASPHFGPLDSSYAKYLDLETASQLASQST